MLREVVLSYPLTLIQLPINSIIVTHYLKNAICMKNPEII